MSDLIKPGRQTGKAPADISELFGYAYKVYVALQQSADGANDSIDGMRKRLTALETAMTSLTAKIAAIAGITILDFTIDDPVQRPQGVALQAAINQIINGAKTEADNGSSSDS